MKDESPSALRQNLTFTSVVVPATVSCRHGRPNRAALYATEDFWRNESNGLERNIRAESRALQTGEAIDFDRASSSSGRKGLADSTTDCATDTRRDDGS